MTALQDIVSTYVNALQQIENILPTAIGASTNANNNFSQIRYNLLDSGKISFSGLGATAFDNSVYQNLGQAQHLLIKLDNVNEATNHTRIEIQNVTHNYDSLLNLPAPNVEIEAIGWYGYSTLDIQNRIKDCALSGFTIDTILDPHILGDQGTIGCRVKDMEREIEGEVRAIHDHHVSVINEEPHDPNNPGDVRNNDVKNRIQDEDMHLNMALAEIKKIAPYVQTNIEEFVRFLQGATAGYIQALIAASQVNMISVGEVIDRLTDANSAPIMIWREPDGSLIVGIGDNKNVTPQMVEQAIAEYIQANHLDPKSVHMTIVGYLHGGDVAQRVVDDVDHNQKQYQYNINNVELIGSTLTANPDQDLQTEFDVYSFSRDLSDSGGWGSVFTPDWLGLGTGTGASFATGISLSNGGGALIGAATGYLTGVLENYDKADGSKALQTQMNNMDPNHYFRNVGNNRNIDQASLVIIPDEPGAHDPSITSDVHYDHSTYLNSLPVPDAIAVANQTMIKVTDPKTKATHREMPRWAQQGTLSTPANYYTAK